jgi:uncharacterized protein YkwD
MGSPGDTGRVLRKLILTTAVASLALAATPAPSSAAGLIAPTAACPNQTSLLAAAPVQEAAMLCMANYAREQTGLGELEPTGSLEESARDKARDILDCDTFSHDACGREFTYWMRESGYTEAQCWRVGENLAWGAGEYGTVRSIFRAWMRSPEHRANLLGNYTQTGIDLRTGALGDVAGTRVWAEHFGDSRC